MYQDHSVLVNWSIGEGPHEVGHLRVWFQPKDSTRINQTQLHLFRGMEVSDLRRFAWRRWIAVARFAYEAALNPSNGAKTMALVDGVKTSRAGTRPSRSTGAKRGRKPKDDKFFEEVAARWNKASKEGSFSPTQDTALEMNYSRSAMGNHVKTARDKGLIPPVTKKSK